MAYEACRCRRDGLVSDGSGLCAGRERLREAYGAALERLIARRERQRNFSDALRLARRLPALDPIAEPVHCLVMRYCALSGDRAAWEFHRPLVGAMDAAKLMEIRDRLRLRTATNAPRPAAQTPDLSPYVTRS